MTEPAGTLEELADAYLDGDLPREEALAFERDLAQRPELGQALASALALRELLVGLPPLAPPAGLAARIAGALPLSRERAARQPRDAEPSASAARAALSSLSWALRGPMVAAMGVAAPAASASSGVSQVRWVLGPLGVQPEPEPRPPPRALWKRVLFGRRKP
jgi:anti-sigma factor RsiW